MGSLVQSTDSVIVNITIIAMSLLLLFLVHWAIRRWKYSERFHGVITFTDGPFSGQAFDAHAWPPRIARMLRLANIASTFIVLIPLGIAIYGLISGNLRFAFQFDVLGFALVVVKAVVGWVFAWFIVPLIQNVPIAGAGWAFRRWRQKKTATK